MYIVFIDTINSLSYAPHIIVCIDVLSELPITIAHTRSLRPRTRSKLGQQYLSCEDADGSGAAEHPRAGKTLMSARI